MNTLRYSLLHLCGNTQCRLKSKKGKLSQRERQLTQKSRLIRFGHVWMSASFTEQAIELVNRLALLALEKPLALKVLPNFYGAT